MHWSRILGLALLVIGVILLYMGWSASQSVTEDLHQTLTGRFTDSTVQLVVAGGAATIVGLVLLLVGVRR